MTMPAGVDLSNLQGHPVTWSSQPWYPIYQAADFAIVQALEPPPGFPGHDFVDPETGKRGYTGVALRQAKADGKKVGIYVWLWFGLADTYGNIRSRLDCKPPSVELDLRVWVDVEDTTGGPGLRDVAAVMGVPREHMERVARQLQCEGRPSE